MSQLWIRALDAVEAKPIAGTERVRGSGFWSPDSRFLVFSSEGRLRKFDLFGGSIQTICDIPPGNFRGGAWNSEGVILFGLVASGLWQISNTGGPRTQVTRVDPSLRELHHQPAFLPDGRHFLYHRLMLDKENSGIFLGSLDSKPEQQSSKRLIPSDNAAVFSADPGNSNMGRLVFTRDRSLMTQAFDVQKLEPVGEEVLITQAVGPDTGIRPYSVSSTGVLAYRRGTARGAALAQLAWVDQNGKEIAASGGSAEYSGIALSPDATHAAVTISAGQQVRSPRVPSDIWIHEFTRGTGVRLTSNPLSDVNPTWSPDGRRIVYSAQYSGAPYDLYEVPSTGAGSEIPVLRSDEDKLASDWSRDGRFLLYAVTRRGTVGNPAARYDLWWLPMTGEDRKPRPYLNSRFDQGQGRFSPDGRYVAYRSNSSGIAEIYVQPFPDAKTGKWTVSKGGGHAPVWRDDGKELYFISGDGKLMAVDVTTNPVFEAGLPRVLFQIGAEQSDARRYAVSPDGKKFLIGRPLPDSGVQAPRPITVVLNWTSLLKK